MIQVSLWINSFTTDLERALRYAMLWGLEGIELGMLKHNRVPNINEAQLRHHLGLEEEEETEVLFDEDFGYDPDDDDEDEEPLEIMAISPSLFQCFASDKLSWLNDLMLLEEAIRFCEKFSCKTILISSFIREENAQAQQISALKRAGDQAAAHGITLGVLNEAGMTAESGEELAALIMATNHPNVKAAWQPIVALQAGASPKSGVEALGNHVQLVRVHNGVQRAQHKLWQNTALDAGAISWEQQIQTLLKNDFQGIFSLGVFSDEKGKQGLRDATYLIQTIRKMNRDKDRN